MRHELLQFVRLIEPRLESCLRLKLYGVCEQAHLLGSPRQTQIADVAEAEPQLLPEAKLTQGMHAQEYVKGVRELRADDAHRAAARARGDGLGFEHRHPCPLFRQVDGRAHAERARSD